MFIAAVNYEIIKATYVCYFRQAQSSTCFTLLFNLQEDVPHTDIIPVQDLSAIILAAQSALSSIEDSSISIHQDAPLMLLSKDTAIPR